MFGVGVGGSYSSGDLGVPSRKGLQLDPRDLGDLLPRVRRAGALLRNIWDQEELHRLPGAIHVRLGVFVIIIIIRVMISIISIIMFIV